jgi:hypothetical protein
LSAKFATKDFNEIKIYSFTDAVITFPGSSDNERVRKSGRESTYVPKIPAFIMIRPELWVT